LLTKPIEKISANCFNQFVLIIKFIILYIYNIDFFLDNEAQLVDLNFDKKVFEGFFAHFGLLLFEVLTLQGFLIVGNQFLVLLFGSENGFEEFAVLKRSIDELQHVDPDFYFFLLFKRVTWMDRNE